MYSRQRLFFIRNLAISLINGLITLIILLIAPLGLLAVIVNTVLIMISTFFVATLGDGIVRWLLPNSQSAALSSEQGLGKINSLEAHRKLERPDLD